MKKYIFLSRIFLSFFVLSLVCCENKYIPDPIDPRLPKYTEEGRGAAGALINGQIWRSVVQSRWWGGGEDYPNITIYPNTDSLIIRFSGQMSVNNTTVEFHLKGLNIQNFDNLINLKNKKIALDGIVNTGVCILFNNPIDTVYYGTKGIGQLYIRNVTVMSDSISENAILSGTFGYTCKDSLNKAYEVSYGRFDYNIYRNFYYFSIK